MPKVLIFTAGYGEGHNSAARALKAAFDEQPGVEAELVDLFALRAPRFNNLSRRSYLQIINTAPKLWSGIYRWLDESPRAPAILRTLASHRRLLGRIIAEKQPVALVSTYPVYAWLINPLRAEGKVTCPLFTVVTDALTINSLWYRAPSDGWFVTDPDSAAFLHTRGVPADRVHVSGFPVDLAFADRPASLDLPDLSSRDIRGKRGAFGVGSERHSERDAAAPLEGRAPARPQLQIDSRRSGGSPTLQRCLPPVRGGWDDTMSLAVPHSRAVATHQSFQPRVLFMINSSRSSALPIARALLEKRDWRITFTAGKDAGLRHELEQMAHGAPARAEILGWTDRIPELLMTHHAVISKAGGATTQESINALCPLIVSQIVPGQEEGNYQLLKRHNAGALATTPESIVTILEAAFSRDALLWHHWRKNLKALARPTAARDIARQVASKSTRPVAGIAAAK